MKFITIQVNYYHIIIIDLEFIVFFNICIYKNLFHQNYNK
jgi:hypothetical protein